MSKANVNQYEPWVELGISEAAYFKRRYLEVREETQTLASASLMALGALVAVKGDEFLIVVELAIALQKVIEEPCGYVDAIVEKAKQRKERGDG